MTKFEKGVKIKDKLAGDHPMVEAVWEPATTDSDKLNKHSLAELDAVLDKMIDMNPEWKARLEQIIEDSK